MVEINLYNVLILLGFAELLRYSNSSYLIIKVVLRKLIIKKIK